MLATGFGLLLSVAAVLSFDGRSAALAAETGQATAGQPPTAQAPRDPLAKVEAKVDKDFRNVKQLSAAQLTEMAKTDKSIVIFDAREEAEYKVSHIPGAERIDPGIWNWTFNRKYADRLKGKTVVFYCSVGVRSSKLAAMVQKSLAEKGAKGVYNLRGGIFRWHNDKRPLVNAKGKTPLVHPYDKYWGRLINRQSYVSYKPEK